MSTKSKSIQTCFSWSCSCILFSRRSSFENWFELTRKSVIEEGRVMMRFLRKLRFVSSFKPSSTQGNCWKRFSCRFKILRFVSFLKLLPSAVKWFLASESHFRFDKFSTASPTLEISFPSSESLSSWSRLLTSFGKLLNPTCANHSSFKLFKFDTADGRQPSLL